MVYKGLPPINGKFQCHPGADGVATAASTYFHRELDTIFDKCVRNGRFSRTRWYKEVEKLIRNGPSSRGIPKQYRKPYFTPEQGDQILRYLEKDVLGISR